MASSANAEGTGARVRRRELKSGKKSKSVVGSPLSFNPSSVTVGLNSLNTAPVIINTKSSLQQMKDKCPNEAEAVHWCATVNPYTQCQECVLGQTKINSNPGGRQACIKYTPGCNECKIEDIENLYKCEMGLNTTSINTNSTSTNSNSTTTPDMTAPATGTTGSGVSAEVSSGGGLKLGMHPAPFPGSVCPPNPPLSGDSCNTGEYQYSRCPYPTIHCSCRFDTNPQVFMCNKN